MYKTLSAPIMVQWEVTGSCNHNCIHCYNYWRREVPKQKLVDGYEAIYQRIVNELKTNRVFSTIITGGEPLIVIKQIAPFVKALTDDGIWVTMNSNLTLLDRDKAKLICDCGIHSILVSIPSADPETCDQITNSSGSLSRVVRGIRLAQEFGITLFTNMVVSRINKHQVKETAEMVASLGLRHFAATRAADPSSNKEFVPWQLDLQEFRQMQTDLEEAGERLNLRINSLEANPVCAYGGIKPTQGYKFCSAGKTTCTVGFDGSVRPCNRTGMVYGNVVENGLEDSWLGMDNWRSGVWIPDECSDCRLKNFCSGGCKVDAMTAFGNPKAIDPLCDLGSKPVRIQQDQPKPLDRDKFTVNPKLRNRPEEFGAILCVLFSNWIPVGHELKDLLTTGKEVVNIEEIGHALGVGPDESMATAVVLVQKRILL